MPGFVSPNVTIPVSYALTRCIAGVDFHSTPGSIAMASTLKRTLESDDLRIQAKAPRAAALSLIYRVSE